MAGSRHFAPQGSFASVTPPKTPGPTGKNDAADPNMNLPRGDSPGPVGVNDRAATHAANPQNAAAKTDTTDPAIEALNLGTTARRAAYQLKKKHPSIIFTSGRRDKSAQASAMASNVALNRNWIKQTYAKSQASDACQKWVDNNKDKTTKNEITDGLKTVLDGLNDRQLANLSRHLAGQAFDVKPVDTDAHKIKTSIRGLKGISKFLDKEGGLVRWHAEF